MSFYPGDLVMTVDPAKGMEITHWTDKVRPGMTGVVVSMEYYDKFKFGPVVDVRFPAVTSPVATRALRKLAGPPQEAEKLEKFLERET